MSGGSTHFLGKGEAVSDQRWANLGEGCSKREGDCVLSNGILFKPVSSNCQNAFLIFILLFRDGFAFALFHLQMKMAPKLATTKKYFNP